MAAGLQEWARRRRRMTQAAPLLMKMVVALAQKEEEDAARLSTRGQLGSEPPANEAVSAAADLLEVAGCAMTAKIHCRAPRSSRAKRAGPIGVGRVGGGPAGMEELPGSGEL